MSAPLDPRSAARLVGRGSPLTPPNRFERQHHEPDPEAAPAPDDDSPGEARRVPTQFLPDATRSLIVANDSPDVGFRYSINPYRGCEHGCAYCYARPGHEYLGMNAGLDFETQILVKHEAPALLREDLNRPNWRGEVIAISGVTDCYQPAERRFRLTRGCLEVLSEAHQACGIVTKNSLMLRDLDLLVSLARRRLAHVYVSVTTLDAQLARSLEPRTSPPAKRLEAIARLAEASVPVGVMAAPIIPGLNDQELPAILAAARSAGAVGAGYTLLRLPLAVRPIFEDWLQRHRPLQARRILGRIRDTRGGRLNDSQFGRRMRGQGEYAATIAATFKAFARKLGLDRGLPELDTSQFRPPRSASGQQRLF
jgi:DNA repair photolyase